MPSWGPLAQGKAGGISEVLWVGFSAPPARFCQPEGEGAGPACRGRTWRAFLGVIPFSSPASSLIWAPAWKLSIVGTSIYRTALPVRKLATAYMWVSPCHPGLGYRLVPVGTGSDPESPTGCSAWQVSPPVWALSALQKAGWGSQPGAGPGARARDGDRTISPVPAGSASSSPLEALEACLKGIPLSGSLPPQPPAASGFRSPQPGDPGSQRPELQPCRSHSEGRRAPGPRGAEDIVRSPVPPPGPLQLQALVLPPYWCVPLSSSRMVWEPSSSCSLAPRRALTHLPAPRDLQLGSRGFFNQCLSP